MQKGRSAALNELDRITVRVRYPRGAEVGQEVVRWAERGRVARGQTRVGAVGVVRPEHNLDRPSTEIRAQAVLGNRSVDRGDSDRESIETQLDVDWRPHAGRPKRFAEAEALVEPDQSHDIAGVDVNGGVPKRSWRG